MCQFFQLIANGENQAPSGLPGLIRVFGRVTTDCTEVEIVVRDAANTLIHQEVVTPGTSVSEIGGVDTRTVEASFSNADRQIECGARLTVTMTCTRNATCTVTETIEVQCKSPPPDRDCPDANALAIVVTSGGLTVDTGQPCVPSGGYTAEVTGVAPGDQLLWTLQVGTASSSLAPTNPTSFTAPPGGDDVIVTVIVIPAAPGCPPITKSVVLPERQAGPCPSELTYRLEKDGLEITERDDLDSGTYTVTVLSPTGPGVQYTFSLNGPVQQSGPSPIYSFTLPGGGGEVLLIITAQAGDCCPPVSNATTLRSRADADPVEPDEDEDDGEDPGTDPGENGNGNGGGFSLCGFLYVLLMLAVVAFIALWVASFSLFPVSAPVLIALGVALAVVIALLAVMSVVCGFGFCRRMRVLAWMFIWSAIACMIAWIASLFVLLPLLIGALVAGLVAMVIGLVMASRNCAFLNLFRLP
jgi:hypothetical protein